MSKKDWNMSGKFGGPNMGKGIMFRAKRDLGWKKEGLLGDEPKGEKWKVSRGSRLKKLSWKRSSIILDTRLNLSSMASSTWFCCRSFSSRESMRSPLIHK